LPAAKHLSPGRQGGEKLRMLPNSVTSTACTHVSAGLKQTLVSAVSQVPLWPHHSQLRCQQRHRLLTLPGRLWQGPLRHTSPLPCRHVLNRRQVDRRAAVLYALPRGNDYIRHWREISAGMHEVRGWIRSCLRFCGLHAMPIWYVQPRVRKNAH
jgi:hypothetical protein